MVSRCGYGYHGIDQAVGEVINKSLRTWQTASRPRAFISLI